MEFITAEQFLKEDKEVQDIFIDWWEPSEFDVYSIKEDLSIHRVCKSDIEDYKNDELYNIKSGYCIPLLTEGQLRQFIEDKTGGKVEFYPDVYNGRRYYTIIIRETGCGGDDPTFEPYANNVLEAYWKVAVQIAKESIDK